MKEINAGLTSAMARTSAKRTEGFAAPSVQATSRGAAPSDAEEGSELAGGGRDVVAWNPVFLTGDARSVSR